MQTDGTVQQMPGSYQAGWNAGACRQWWETGSPGRSWTPGGQKPFSTELRAWDRVAVFYIPQVHRELWEDGAHLF